MKGEVKVEGKMIHEIVRAMPAQMYTCTDVHMHAIPLSPPIHDLAIPYTICLILPPSLPPTLSRPPALATSSHHAIGVLGAVTIPLDNTQPSPSLRLLEHSTSTWTAVLVSVPPP